MSRRNSRGSGKIQAKRYIERKIINGIRPIRNVDVPRITLVVKPKEKNERK